MLCFYFVFDLKKPFSTIVVIFLCVYLYFVFGSLLIFYFRKTIFCVKVILSRKYCSFGLYIALEQQHHIDNRLAHFGAASSPALQPSLPSIFLSPLPLTTWTHHVIPFLFVFCLETAPDPNSIDSPSTTGSSYKYFTSSFDFCQKSQLPCPSRPDSNLAGVQLTEAPSPPISSPPRVLVISLVLCLDRHDLPYLTISSFAHRRHGTNKSSSTRWTKSLDIDTT